MTQTSETFGGTLVNTTEEDSAGTPNTPGTYLNTRSVADREEVTELTDVPEPTFSDPDANTIEVSDQALPRSDYKAGPYNLDTWYEPPTTNP